MGQTTNQTFSIIFPSGTPAGTQEKTIILDRKYDRSLGWAVYVNNAAAQRYVRVGLRDDQQDILKPINVQFLQAGVDCPKNSRWTPVDARADGTNLYVQVQFPDALTDELNLDVVFNLQKD